MTHKNKHTPGPWSAEIGNGGFQINAEMHAVANSLFCYAEEYEANAHLIAAAPDLLEALELCFDALNHGVDVPEENQGSIIWVLEETKQAIAKARGEE